MIGPEEAGRIVHIAPRSTLPPAPVPTLAVGVDSLHPPTHSLPDLDWIKLGDRLLKCLVGFAGQTGGRRGVDSSDRSPERLGDPSRARRLAGLELLDDLRQPTDPNRDDHRLDPAARPTQCDGDRRGGIDPASQAPDPGEQPSHATGNPAPFILLEGLVRRNLEYDKGRYRCRRRPKPVPPPGPRSPQDLCRWHPQASAFSKSEAICTPVRFSPPAFTDRQLGGSVARCPSRQVIPQSRGSRRASGTCACGRVLSQHLVHDQDRCGTRRRYSWAVRIRTGDYRIIYAVENASRTVLIATIGHRRKVCRR